MIIAVAGPGKEKRTKGFAGFGTGDGFDMSIFIFIALLWPIWLLLGLSKKDQS